MSAALFTQKLKESRRDALVSHYIAKHNFGTYNDKINSSNDLYEYLLLDTKVSDSVTTSPLSEAVSSLQLFIHRTMEGYDGDLANNNEVNGWFAQDAFLNNWDQYNKRYSTWAGKEKLRFYAGNYIESSLRMRKTKLFETLEQGFNEGRISSEHVRDEVGGYISNYQELADLEYVSSCEDSNVIYFIGRSGSGSQKFYFRKFYKDDRHQSQKWSEWFEINVTGSDVPDNKLLPFISRNSLSIYWFTRVNKGSQAKQENDDVIYYNEATLNAQDKWTLAERSEFYLTQQKIVVNNLTAPFPFSSIPVKPWEGDCIQQVYERYRAVHFLCKKSEKWIINTIPLTINVDGDRPYQVKSKELILEGFSKIANENISFYMNGGQLYVDYFIESDPFKTTYSYKVDSVNGAIFYRKGERKPASIDDVELLVTGRRTISEDKLNAEVVNISDADSHNNKKDISFSVGVFGETMIITNTGGRDLSSGKKNNDGFTLYHTGDSWHTPIVEGVKVYGVMSKVSIFECVNVKASSSSDDTFDMGSPTFYGKIDNKSATLIPPENDGCPCFGFEKIKADYPYFDLAGYLSELEEDRFLGNLYNYSLQEKDKIGGDAAFKGHNQIYLWEIFFHIPFLVATRFATEQRFEEAERWYKYIFNSAGYRDEDGKLIMDGKIPRYWNCYPLQQDTAWDALADLPASTDPDVIATADPMHYKLAILQHTLDLLIARGDAAYRMLERDTLAQAKMYYVQAQQLLGPRPDIRITNTWDNPTLEKAAGAINKPATRDSLPQTFAQWLRAGDRNEMGDGDFLPAYNDVLLAYWDKLDIRLFNLRHNLSLNGQPLDLPLFATPADPKKLHRQQSGGDGVQGDVSPANTIDTGWRYPLLADHARNAASQLSQFGSSLLNALERRDSEQLTLLLQTQQIAVLSQQQDIAQKNLDSLGATLTSLNASLASARLRKNHYTQLMNGNLSAQEQKGLTLRTESRGQTQASQVMATMGGALSALPNTFGLANGGGDLGAPLKAASMVMQMVATANEQSAVISDISAGYQRRAEEWGLQRDLADKDLEQMQAQIDSLSAQIAMQQKQILLTETESAHAQALYELQSSRFTGQALYNWMVGRLSALYYQLYDNTVPVCLQARKALTRELGSDKADGLFNTSVWNDLYQGLLAGEGLTTELQKLNNVWLQHSALGWEATRTVSLAVLRGEESGSLSTVIGKVLLGTEDTSKLGKLKLKDGIFSAVLDLSTLGLNSAYNDTSRRRFIKSISVTLPTLLGPYQDIEASLSGGGEMATLSHGMQDVGRFVTNFDDSRFLPFEGMELKKGAANSMTLSIFNVKGADEALQNQRAIVENLSDIIFHIHYIMR